MESTVNNAKRLGVRALARELGVSPAAVCIATKSGRIAKGADGLYDVEEARTRFKASHPIQQANARATQPAERKEAAKASAAASPDPKPVEIGKDTLAEAVRQEKWIKVRKEQLLLEERMGSLVLADEVREFVSAMILEAKEVLLRVPGELKAVLAGETDMNRIESVLLAEMYRALGRLRSFRPDKQAAA